MVQVTLHCSVVDARARDVMYLLLHNKLPVQERLFRIKLKNDPYCQRCVGAEIADIEHYFSQCDGIVGTWTLVKKEILRYGKFHNNVDDWRILNLLFPKSRLDKELTWLISSYFLYVGDILVEQMSGLTSSLGSCGSSTRSCSKNLLD